MIMSIRDIAESVNSCQATIRTLLGRAEFNKYCVGMVKPAPNRHKCICYEVDDAFIKKLKEFICC